MPNFIFPFSLAGFILRWLVFPRGRAYSAPYDAFLKDAAQVLMSPSEARDRRLPEENDLVPFWLFPGEATIDRYVPSLPLSREVARLENLKKSLAIYRLVFGQPRQEDLVEYLLSRGLDEEEIEELVEELRVDLQPLTSDANK